MFSLEQALDAIKDKPEFSVKDKDNHVVIDYVIQKDDTFKGKNEFENIILKNLRGTAFEKNSGRIISLPLHKFHNLGENEEYSENNLDLSGVNIDAVLLKHDGSMIRPIPVMDGTNAFRLGTRAGVTDVSMKAENWLVADLTRYEIYLNFISKMISVQFTPVFEYVGPNNKIVLDYSKENLILLAIRKNISGEYITYNELKYIGEENKIPVVTSITEPLKNIKDWENQEGVVVKLNSGFMLKVKSDWYVLRHRTLDLIKFQKDIVKLIVENKIDDILPIIPDEDKKEKLREYNKHVNQKIFEFDDSLKSIFEKEIQILSDKKEMALYIKEKHPKISKFIFSLISCGETGAKDFLLKSCNSGPNCLSACNLLGIKNFF